MPQLLIRRMTDADLGKGLELTQAQQWSHGLGDWAFHFQLGRGWVACDDEGTVVGTALWWAYGEHFGTVGLVVVAPGFQGRGIGRELFNSVLEDAGPRVLQLIATDAGLKLYRQSGFRDEGYIAQRQGFAQLQSPGSNADTHLRAVQVSDLPALIALDEAAVGADRSHIIRAVFEEQVGGTLAARNGAVAGFCLARLSGKGTVIGPVVAEDEALAQALIAHQLRSVEGFVRLDVPTDAEQLSAWLEDIGLKKVDRVTPMVRVPPGVKPLEHSAGMRTFGLVSQALS